MENRVIKHVDDAIKKTKKKLLDIIDEIEESIPEIAEEIA